MTTGTAGALIQAAFEDASLCPVGATISTGQLNRGLDRLNDIINLWATQGLKLWLQQIISVPLVASQADYTFGPGGNINMTKPLAMLQGTYVYTNGQRQPLTVMSRDEYIRLSQLGVDGAINSYVTNKGLPLLAVSFYNSPDTTAAANGTVEMLARVSAPNVVISADSVQFPPEWYIALRWAVADEICVAQSEAIQNRCAVRAAAYREALEGFDVEDALTFFTPDSRVQMSNSSFR